MHFYSAYLPFAIVHEVVRQFHGQNSNFTVSCLGGVENVNILVAARLVKRLIGSYAELILPSPTFLELYSAHSRGNGHKKLVAAYEFYTNSDKCRRGYLTNKT